MSTQLSRERLTIPPFPFTISRPLRPATEGIGVQLLVGPTILLNRANCNNSLRLPEDGISATDRYGALSPVIFGV